MAGIISSRPDSLAPESIRLSGDELLGFAGFGWVMFLITVYLSGRYSEVSIKCHEALGGTRREAHIDGLLLWMIPLPVFIVSGAFWWILWRIPDAVKWAVELLLGLLRS